jgi:GNAT superfamily N-acetyltransferase
VEKSFEVVASMEVSLERILDLVADAMRFDPGWVEDVDPSKLDDVRRWWETKSLSGGWVVMGDDGRVVAHLGVRCGVTDLVGESLVGLGGEWVELCRAVVHPQFRNRGLLGRLVGVARSDVGGRGMWLTCVAGTASHHVWNRLGFRDVATVVFPVGVDRRPGVLCVTK